MSKSSIIELVESMKKMPEEFILDCTVTLKGVDQSDLYELHKEYGSKTFHYRGSKLITISLSDKLKITAKIVQNV